MLDYIISLGVAFLLIVLGVQFRRGKWLGILAGNILSDKPIEEQKKNAKGCTGLIFVEALFFILLAFFEWRNLNPRPLYLFFGVPFLIYVFVIIACYIKHFIKYGE